MAEIAMDMEGPICVVCMEPMGWVAVAPCGHLEVCVRCAATIRFFHNDLRCCICRAHCPTVVVTKAGGRRERGFHNELLVGRHYCFYHRGMAAYFDDVHQYREMNRFCTKPASRAPRYPAALLLPQPAAAAVNVTVPPSQAQAPLELEEDPSSSEMESSLVCIAVLLSLLAIGGFLMVAEHPYPKLLILVLLAVLFSAFAASMVYAWRKFRNNNGDE